MITAHKEFIFYRVKSSSVLLKYYLNLCIFWQYNYIFNHSPAPGAYTLGREDDPSACIGTFGENSDYRIA